MNDNDRNISVGDLVSWMFNTSLYGIVFEMEISIHDDRTIRYYAHVFTTDQKTMFHTVKNLKIYKKHD